MTHGASSGSHPFRARGRRRSRSGPVRDIWRRVFVLFFCFLFFNFFFFFLLQGIKESGKKSPGELTGSRPVPSRCRPAWGSVRWQGDAVQPCRGIGVFFLAKSRWTHPHCGAQHLKQGLHQPLSSVWCSLHAWGLLSYMTALTAPSAAGRERERKKKHLKHLFSQCRALVAGPACASVSGCSALSSTCSCSCAVLMGLHIRCASRGVGPVTLNVVFFEFLSAWFIKKKCFQAPVSPSREHASLC